MQNAKFNIYDIVKNQHSGDTKIHMEYDATGLIFVYTAPSTAVHGDTCQRIPMINNGNQDPTDIINTTGWWDSAWDVIDILIPGFINGTPSVSNITTIGFDLNFEIDKAGNIYYVILEKGKNTPRFIDVVNGVGYKGEVAVLAGNIMGVVPSTPQLVTVNTLLADTEYEIFIVQEDVLNNQNVQLNPLVLTTKTNEV